MDSKFAFAAATPKVKGDLSTTPELTVTCTKDKIRLNSALTRKLLLQTTDRLMFITNEESVLAAVANGELSEDEVSENLMFAIAKGVIRTNSKGEVITELKRLNKAERKAVDEGTYEGEVDEEGRPIEPAMHGFKLASNGNEEGYGRILEGSDATQWPKLKGNTEKHMVYTLGDKIEVTIGNADVEAYVINFDREEAKLERKKSEKADTDQESTTAIVD